MQQHLKLFANHSAYSQAESSLDKPNVVLCQQENEIYYNPNITIPKLIITYNVLDSSNPTQLYLYYDEEGIIGDNMFNSIEIDDITMSISELDLNQGTYQLSEGEHIVKYTLKDPTSIGFIYGSSSFATFEQCSSITSVIIPEGVIAINPYSFTECTNLTSVTVPNSVTKISLEEGFHGTPWLENLYEDPSFQYGNIIYVGNIALMAVSQDISSCTFKNTTTIINEYAFEGCNSLTSVNIPDSVITIEDYAFAECNNLTSVTIGSGVTSIGNNAFQYCSSLTSIIIPNNVITIKNGAFDSCSGLTSITIGNKVTTIEDFAFNLQEGNVTSITIPNSVTSIGKYAFAGCGLTSINIPSSVINIDEQAFTNSSLTNITVDNNNSVYDSRNNCNAIIKTSTNELIQGCSNTIIPNAIISIGVGAFAGCSGLTSINIPDSVTSIGEGAFQNSNLESINLPNNLITIGSQAFDGCEHLRTSIIIPNTVTTIGGAAFRNCRALPFITIGSGLTTLEWSIFENCRALSTITIPDNITTIKTQVFQWCDNLTSITIGNGVTSIDRSAFNCSNLTSIICLKTIAPTINDPFMNLKPGTLYVPIGSSGYDVWMQQLNRYNWTKIEQ